MKTKSAIGLVLILLNLTLFITPPQSSAQHREIIPFESDDTLEEIRYKIEANGYKFTVDHNWVYDMAPGLKKEFFSRHLPLFPNRLEGFEDIGPLAKSLGKIELPSRLDWRNYNGHSYIGPIKSQGPCGSCYAFGAGAAAEGTYNWATGRYDGNCADFSESYIIWCVGRLPRYSEHFFGCGGADYDYYELEALTQVGIISESDFPYQATDPGSCTHWNDQTIAFASWHRIPCNDIEAIKTAIMVYGVVVAAVDSNRPAFGGYSGGIYEDSYTSCFGNPPDFPECYYTLTDHSIALVGWDDNGDPENNGYWILRNSWGTNWGENGYMRIKYHSARVACDVAYLVYPSVPPPPPILELRYSTYLGGSADDYGYAIALDSENQAYVTGYTHSDDFPIDNPFQLSRMGYYDVLVSKLSSSGSSLVYSTYLGGSRYDYGRDIAVDSDNRVYLTGNTQSDDFPTENPYQSKSGGVSDAFVSLLSSSGSSLVYSSYLGGFESDFGFGICLDSENRVYLTGITNSTDFPTENPYQASISGSDEEFDVFICHFSSSGSSLVYSTYIGGETEDWATGICLDSANRVGVAGYTNSADFPTKNSYQAGYGGGFYDAFASRLSSSGSSLNYSTYLGGGDEDYGCDISRDSENRMYVAGYTLSDDFPIENPYQSSRSGNFDAFVSRLSSSGSSLLYSTYLGGVYPDSAWSIVVDSGDRAYLIGGTQSSDFPTENPYQSAQGGSYDVIISQLSSSGSALVYSTYLGGSHDEYGRGISIDLENNTYITGYTRSSDFPTESPYQSNCSGDYDIFITKLELILPIPEWQLVFDSGDYDGDGTSDIAIFRESSGLWAVREITRIYFGSPSDHPVPGDYSGNNVTDIGIFRSSSGLWAVRNVTRAYFGSSGDQPVPGDYDGDGYCDPGIFRNVSGLWAVRNFTRIYFGTHGDIPVPGDYDGDGTKDIGIFRKTIGLWALKNISRSYFGAINDETVPGDYDGDATWECGIFRPSTGLWAIRGVTRSYFGGSLDYPVPADYNGAGADIIGIFCPSSRLWAIRGVTQAYFGGLNDIPVAR